MNPRQPWLTIDLLGPVRVRVQGQPAAKLSSDKAQALLAYLACHAGAPQRRERLAGLLWPESSETAARASLRNTLAVLRRGIAASAADAPLLTITRHEITLLAGPDCRIDCLAFEKTLLSRPHQPPDPDHLAAALAAYRGVFMEGFTLADCGEFEEWLTVQREHFRRLAVEGYDRMATACLDQGRAEEAMDALRRQVTLEPWLEESHRRLMALLADSGRRSEALAQYRHCRRILVAELGVEPSAATSALHQRIRDDAGLPQLEAPRPALPVPLTPLIGREQEQEELGALMANPEVRLITIVGPGGMGKTHLAQQVAHDQQARFPDRAVFVSLAPVRDAAHVPAAIGEALGLTFLGDQSPEEQLSLYLQNKRALLVLDNLEHLLPARGMILALLRSCPYLTVLCTSRTRLGIHGEQCYPLDGLALPDTGDADRSARAAALELFVQSGRRVDPHFALHGMNRQEVAALCRRVDGLPLGIILAAGWLDLMTPGEIAQRIADTEASLLDLLQSEQLGLAPRHRSLRAVVTSTWDMLSHQEQTVFAALSVCRGSFDDDAATAVAGATLSVLHSLVAKACLQVTDHTGGRRYQIHEYLRQFGAEQLGREAPAQRSANRQHAAYYLAKLARAGTTAQRGQRHSRLQTLTTDAENLRAAWNWAVEEGELHALTKASEPLCRLVEWRGLPRAGVDACTCAVERFASDISPQADRLLATCHSWCAVFYRLLGDPRQAKDHQDQALARLERLTAAGEIHHAEQGQVYLCIGTNALYFDELDHAEDAAQTSIDAFQAGGDGYGQAEAQQLRAWVRFNRGDLRGSLGATRTALQMRRTLADPLGTAESLMGIAMACSALGRLPESMNAARESLALRQAEGDRRGAAHSLSEVATAYLFMGEIEQSAVHAWEVIAQLEEFGVPMWVALELCVRTADHSLHLGRYAQARRSLEQGLATARAQRIRWPIGAALVRLAKVALAEGSLQEAQVYLAEAVPVLRAIQRQDELGDGQITLAVCALLQGDTEEARRHLQTGLGLATEMAHYAVLCHGKAASALLAIVDGNPAAAVEHYELLRREPFVANSCWFAHVYGARIDDAELPPVTDREDRQTP